MAVGQAVQAGNGGLARIVLTRYRQAHTVFSYEDDANASLLRRLA